jgi:hypothetical protein
MGCLKSGRRADVHLPCAWEQNCVFQPLGDVRVTEERER